MQIQREELTVKLFEEALPLLEKHCIESGTSSLQFDPHQILYFKANYQQLYAAYTAREGGNIVGYLGYWIISHPHYSVQMAQQDVFYIREENRGTILPLKLIRFSEKDLKENYLIKSILQGSSSKRDISPIFKRLGYEESSKLFQKEL